MIQRLYAALGISLLAAAFAVAQSGRTVQVDVNYTGSGTVAKISGNVLTVKTAKGDVDVKLGDRTQLTRNDRKAQLADLKPGARVVAEVPEGSRDNTAQSVKIGAVTKTAAVRQRYASQK